MTQRSLVRSLVLCLLLVGLVLLQVRLWTGEGSIRNGRLLTQQVSQVTAENAQLAQRNSLMAADIADLKHGTDQVEEIARKDLGLVKQGEVFYQILGDKPTPDTNLAPAANGVAGKVVNAASAPVATSPDVTGGH